MFVGFISYDGLYETTAVIVALSPRSAHEGIVDTLHFRTMGYK